MKKSKLLSNNLYQILGKLFYAIAAIDKNVKIEEYNKLKEIVKSEWLVIDELEDEFHTDAAYQIEIVFDWLYAQKVKNDTTFFEEFETYRNEQGHLFTQPVKQLILKTANEIAYSFSKKNKSELIILAKLNAVLK